GDVFTVDGEPLTGGAHEPGPPAMVPQAFTNNTTLVVVATDAAFDRIELRRLVFRAHDAIAACIRPAHTRWDGDIVFAVSCGEVEGDCDIAAEAAFAATAAAIESAVRNAAARRLAQLPTGDQEHPRVRGAPPVGRVLSGLRARRHPDQRRVRGRVARGEPHVRG